MEEMTVYVYSCAEQLEDQVFGLQLNDLVTAGISVATLLLNILFYIIIAPRISFRFQKKEDFLKYSADFISYLSEVNSLTNFDGVPTKVKSFCVSIELLFKNGVAPNPLHADMEEVFQAVKRRKEISSIDEISTWELEFREKTQKLRKSLAKYTGAF